MRLLHAESLEFKLFHNDEALPPYAILSHTWTDEEVTYQDMRFHQKFYATPEEYRNNPLFLLSLDAAAAPPYDQNTKPIEQRIGYKKIIQTAKIALQKELQYFWIDTCCIDKSSSAELQEAINSMYKWYQRAAYCIVHLADAASSGRGWNYFRSALQNSKWITRGWTLQELIAPRVVDFYDEDWRYIAGKRNRDSLRDVSRVTRIPRYVIETGDLSLMSVAQKMSWAANRTTTRVEDKAYSLMGLFNVNMPMLYGEGENAFLRLQEEIIRTNPDDSIFAWRDGYVNTDRQIFLRSRRKDDDASKPPMISEHIPYRGLLAKSPSEFRDSSDVTKGLGIFSRSNLGLFVHMDLQPYKREGSNEQYELGLLRARKVSRQIALVLKQLSNDELGPQYTRVFPDMFERWIPASGQLSQAPFYVDHTPRIPPDLVSSATHSFYFRRSDSNFPEGVPTYTISKAWPPQNWHPSYRELLIPQENPSAYGIVWLHDDYNERAFEFSDVPILVHVNRETGTFWCKVLYAKPNHWPKQDDPEELWKAAIEACGPFDECGKEELFSADLDGPHLRVVIEAGLYRGKPSLIVVIDSLEF